MRVLETYDSATIEWSRTKDHKDWIGQLVYGTSLGSPAGVVQAQAVIGAVWSAWTELFPSFGESQLLLTVHGHGESTVILSHHAFLVSLALARGGPEVAGDDYVDLAGARTVYAGIVVDAAGAAVELAGDLYGYAVDAAGGRQTCCSTRTASAGTGRRRRRPRRSSFQRPSTAPRSASPAVSTETPPQASRSGARPPPVP